jgi:hypothetical protein
MFTPINDFRSCTCSALVGGGDLPALWVSRAVSWPWQSGSVQQCIAACKRRQHFFALRRRATSISIQERANPWACLRVLLYDTSTFPACFVCALLPSCTCTEKWLPSSTVTLQPFCLINRNLATTYHSNLVICLWIEVFIMTPYVTVGG